jgi:hypothetical protein
MIRLRFDDFDRPNLPKPAAAYNDLQIGATCLRRERGHTNPP